MRVLQHCPSCGHRPPMTLDRCPECGSDLEPHPLSTDSRTASWAYHLIALAALVGLGVWLLLG